MKEPGYRRATFRAFIPYAGLSLIPVLILGAVLAFSYRTQAGQRGVARGRAEAVLIAQTAIAPLLDGRALGTSLSSDEKAKLQWTVDKAVHGGEVLRLRLRNLAGRVVYSDDGSGFSSRPEDEALEAAHGEVVAQLTHLNKDSNDTGPLGVPAVEVYQPLSAGSPADRVGVLELYLPYAPIAQDISAGLRSMYLDLAIGLVALYLVLLGVSASATRGLRRAAAHNEFLAGHDALTGLANRTLFHDKGAEALFKLRRRRRPTAVAIVDLDRFKAVNDTLGHHTGDLLLREIGSRLAASTRDTDTVARLGGDEFGLILREAHEAEELLYRLRTLVEEEAEISGLPLSVGASIGYAVGPEDGSDIDELMRRADVALYHAKANHLGVARYEVSQNPYNAENLALISDFRHAISRDELVLHYQPKTRLADGSPSAVEALVRWQHPGLGLLYPDRFLPMVEQTDLIDDLTRWVVARAIADLAGLPGNIAVCVNVSARNLARPEFAGEVHQKIRDAGVPPNRLIVELTETALLTDPARAGEALGSLANSGVRISVDDFGAGQTSLGYLSALPLAEIKIDRSFVADMLTNSTHAAIVRSVVELGHNLHLEVVAEGVETEGVRDQLRIFGCDIAQGYLYARPMPFHSLIGWLAEANASLGLPV